MLAPLTITDITQIRTHRQQEQPVVSGSDYVRLVRVTGLEPAWTIPQDPKGIVTSVNDCKSLDNIVHYSTIPRFGQFF